MKRNGNIAVNKVYNPKNVKPDMPLDVDEVNSVMERFIKKKYQERSLGNTKPPTSGGRDTGPASLSLDSPPPPLPPKKGKFFGFGLRASSSEFSPSKYDKKDLPIEPTMDNAFRISSEHYNKPSRGYMGPNAGVLDTDLAGKLTTLRDMGFPDTKRNSTMLKGLNGDLERTVGSLVRLGEGSKPSTRDATPMGSSKNTPLTPNFPDSVKNPLAPRQASHNPLEQPASTAQVGLSFGPTKLEQQVFNLSHDPGQLCSTSYDPFDIPSPQQTLSHGLEQSFQGMQISRPLFPHSTGGYAHQSQQGRMNTRLQHSMTPPVPAVPQPFNHTDSPSKSHSNSNPFVQTVRPSQPLLNNPYANVLQNPSSTNPFLNQIYTEVSAVQSPPFPVQGQGQAQSTSILDNPFGLPPADSSLHLTPQDQQRPQEMNVPIPTFDANQQSFSANANTQKSYDSQHQSLTQHQPLSQLPPARSFLNIDHGIASQPQQFQQTQGPPYQSQHQYPTLSYPPQPQHQQQQQILPQQTGRIDKSSIMALYNYPQLAPQLPVEPTLEQSNPSTAMTALPHSNDHNGGSAIASAKRSATMPISSSTTTSRNPSRNPFTNSGEVGGASSGGGVGGISTRMNFAAIGITARHASQESVSISNLESGRHSPDAFANLSARFMR